MNTVFHKQKKVLAIFINGQNMVFNSIKETCEYFNELGTNLYPQQLIRLIAGNGLWEYKDRDNGKEKTVQICFDELLEDE